MKKRSPIQNQKAFFYTSVSIIAIVFVLSIAAILSKHYKPSASQIAHVTHDHTQNFQAATLSGGQASYTDNQGQSHGSTANTLNLTLEYPLVAQVQLDGLGAHHDATTSTSGEVTVVPSGKSLDQAIARSVAWSGASATSDKTGLNATLNYSILDTILNQSIDPPYDLIVKPKHYLSTVVRNVTDTVDPVNVGTATVGDLCDASGDMCPNPDASDDNNVNLRDLSVFVAQYGKASTDGTLNPADFNGDGVVDISDLSKFVSNYSPAGKRGEGL